MKETISFPCDRKELFSSKTNLQSLLFVFLLLIRFPGTMIIEREIVKATLPNSATMEGREMIVHQRELTRRRPITALSPRLGG